MNQNIINRIAVWLFVLLSTISGSAQQETYQQIAQQASSAFRQGEFDTAIELYTEAINSFPKIDDFTPQNKRLKLAGGGFLETPYTGLDGLYRNRAIVYLKKRNLEMAEKDYINAFNVFRYEILRKLDKAKRLRKNADIKKEIAKGDNNIYNSDLSLSAYTFGSVLQVIENQVKRLNNDRYRNYRDLGIKLPPDKEDLPGFEEMVKFHEDALFGRAEAQATLMIEVGNREYSFWALKSADELITAYPKNIEAYRLRAKVNRQWKREEAALADEQKAQELEAQK